MILQITACANRKNAKGRWVSAVRFVGDEVTSRAITNKTTPHVVAYKLFANEMQRHAARVRRCAVLPQINSLPRSEREFAGMDGNGKIHGGQRSADVRGHVVIALGGVAE